ncbi:Oidioi.mRNA.OKI2018_I69.chr2.g7441.t1.cds [Oikopleura dioica]|uniref:Oidioi.mRNA.OKI2018_I69.chr2.g7441.t1.cds n=1 Tax=Oikopleura dioica TaxID=34765 RepID=A0ABN7TCU7_OIKDI|nr:Oidioi.mRNA.OKI2018_I69.chr2.g7441.t1.cds [Oikopleura dioica]
MYPKHATNFQTDAQTFPMAKNGPVKESPKSQGKITDFWKAKTPNKSAVEDQDQPLKKSPKKTAKTMTEKSSPEKMPGKKAGSPGDKRLEKLGQKEPVKSKIPKMDDGTSKFSVGSVRAVLNRAKYVLILFSSD